MLILKSNDNMSPPPWGSSSTLQPLFGTTEMRASPGGRADKQKPGKECDELTRQELDAEETDSKDK